MHFFIALCLVASLSACTAAQNESSNADPVVSLELLKERSEYEALDKLAVEAIARAAEVRWPHEFSGFTYERVERFSAGGVSHWIAIWSHGMTGLEFALVPGGKFQMGSPVTEVNRKEDELRHAVTLDPFLIARTECTQGAWATAANDLEDELARLPKVGLSPADVEIWCRQMRLTLPTEAQWEFMCRSGTTTPWTSGAEKTELKAHANLGSEECPESWRTMRGITEPWHDGFGARSSPVSTFRANAFGLFDVHGNLSEWTRDHYFDYEVPPEKGTGRRAGESGERTARGGSFGGDASAARSARRLRCGAGISPGANHGFGFRPSIDLPFPGGE